jgi:hypothetical protein
MAADWYYTTNKQQMGPVSWDELRTLATKGLLKPADLVWSDGMPEWVKASRQDGLFTGVALSERGSSRPSSLEEPPQSPLSRTRRRIDEEMDERDRDDRRDRKRARSGGGGGMGLTIGLSIGAVLLVVGLLGCGVTAVLVIAFWPRGAGVGGGGEVTRYNLVLGQGGNNDRTFNWRAGQRIQITVTTTRNFGAQRQPDVDLFVNRRGGAFVASDQRISPDCNVTFVVPADDTYIVRVVNLGPGNATSEVVVTAN